jgi:hypothetical protein
MYAALSNYDPNTGIWIDDPNDFVGPVQTPTFRVDVVEPGYSVWLILLAVLAGIWLTSGKR